MASMTTLTSKNELRDWLRGKPRSWAQAIANRVSLRGFPIAGRIIALQFIGKVEPEHLILTMARANYVSAAALIHPDDLRIFVTAADATYAVAKHAKAIEGDPYIYAAARAATYAAAASAAADDSKAADAAVQAVDAYTYIDIADAFWHSVSHDATWLEVADSTSAPERGALLLQQPLWPGNIPALLHASWDSFANSSFAAAHGFQLWIQWYKALASLNADRLPQRVFSDALTLRIATAPNGVWERPASEVNDIIASWLRGDTAPDDHPAPQHDLVQALDALPARQPAPYLFDWRDGHMEVLPPDALPEDGGIVQDYLDETREKADDLLEALARSNTDPTIARKVGRLREVLTERAADLRPALVDSRSISVERLAKALDNPQDAAEMPARILADLGDLADTARRLCNCLPALWQRDAERLANSLSPDSASALLHHLDALRDGIKDADIIGPDVQAAFDTLSEDSAEPDADDVRRRRIAMFGLTARNLLTTLLRASKGAATELVRFAEDVRKELRPEAVKGTAKAIVGLPIAAAYLTVMLIEPATGIAKVFPEIERVVRILEALKSGEGKPPTPPASSEPPLSPRKPRPTAERGPTRPA